MIKEGEESRKYTRNKKVSKNSRKKKNTRKEGIEIYERKGKGERGKEIIKMKKQ